MMAIPEIEESAVQSSSRLPSVANSKKSSSQIREALDSLDESYLEIEGSLGQFESEEHRSPPKLNEIVEEEKEHEDSAEKIDNQD